MTNYNERFDEILKTLDNKARKKRASCTERNNWEGYNSAYERLEHEAKQAITSLIKELVEEAKPSKKHVGDEVAENRSYTGERLFNATIDEFEQNLLKKLEEV